MALSERHRWCASKIVEAFKPELNNDAVQAFIRNEKNLNAFSTFFRGESSGRLFVFYQPERTTSGEDEVRLLPPINVNMTSIIDFIVVTYFHCLLVSLFIVISSLLSVHSCSLQRYSVCPMVMLV